MLGYVCSCIDGCICVASHVRKPEDNLGYVIPQEPSPFLITSGSLTGLQLGK